MIDEKLILEKKLVTVGITNYDYENFIDDAIISVLKQNYGNIELIIVDDFSTDKCSYKIKEYEKKYKNIKVIYLEQNNESKGLAWNDIIKNSNGEYIFFLSAKDCLYDENVITKCVKAFIEDESIDYVYGNIQLVDDVNNKKDVCKYRDYNDNEIVYYTFRQMGSGVLPFSSGMYKRSFYYKNKIEFIYDSNNESASDTLNVLMYTKYGWKRKYIDSNFVCCRRKNKNLSYDLRSKIKSVISVIEYIVNNFNETKYLKDVDWTNLDKALIKSTKNYFIGLNYYNALLMYLQKNEMLWNGDWDFDIEQIIMFLQPIINIIEKYMERSLANGTIYRDNIKIVLNEIKKCKIDVSLNKESKEYILQNEIVDKGKKLRENLLERYKNKYKNNNFKCLIHIPLNGYWKYAFLSWKQILNYMGIKTDIVYKIDPEFDYSYYNTFINISGSIYINDALKNKSINNIKNKIGISAKENSEQLDLINIQLCKKFCYDFLISTATEEAIEKNLCDWIKNNINIVSISFGFNPLINYPEDAKKIYDYFFVGTNSYLKYEDTKKFLMPILSKYGNGILRGTGWGNNIPELNPNNANYFYNRSKINLNYHLLKLQKQNSTEINERTFVIASCGGFQLVDKPKLISNFYTKDDMEIADNEYEYMEKFKYYLNRPLERLEKSYNGLVKTYEKDYSLFKSLEKIFIVIAR